MDLLCARRHDSRLDEQPFTAENQAAELQICVINAAYVFRDLFLNFILSFI